MLQVYDNPDGAHVSNTMYLGWPAPRFINEVLKMRGASDICTQSLTGFDVLFEITTFVHVEVVKGSVSTKLIAQGC